jgi:hypothetical protein
LGTVEEKLVISIYVRIWGIRITLLLVKPSALHYQGYRVKFIPVEV